MCSEFRMRKLDILMTGRAFIKIAFWAFSIGYGNGILFCWLSNEPSELVMLMVSDNRLVIITQYLKMYEFKTVGLDIKSFITKHSNYTGYITIQTVKR